MFNKKITNVVFGSESFDFTFLSYNVNNKAYTSIILFAVLYMCEI